MIRRLVWPRLPQPSWWHSGERRLAGEITGNGRKPLSFEDSKWGTGLHAGSFCAYSGQEDLQWFQDEGTNQVPVENPVKGVPGYAQSPGVRSLRLFGKLPRRDASGDGLQPPTGQRRVAPL